jgi:hypothetical protein
MSAHFRGEKPMSSAKILMTGIVSIVIQFGLAIAGRGGWSAFFAHPALRALSWVTVDLQGCRWGAMVMQGSSALVFAQVVGYPAAFDRVLACLPEALTEA